MEKENSQFHYNDIHVSQEEDEAGVELIARKQREGIFDEEK